MPSQVRRESKFEEGKSMLLSKSTSNVLRIAAVQCALRNARADESGEAGVDGSVECTIDVVDIERALCIIKYSIRCICSIVESCDNR